MLAKDWKPVQVWLSPEQREAIEPDKSGKIRELIDREIENAANLD